MDINILKKIVELSNEDVIFAHAIIINAKGSTPREIGADMIVLENGETIGTIGGGALELKVIDLAKSCMKTNTSATYNLPLNSPDIGMICGGEVDVFIEIYKSKPKLIICGAGHVGKALYEIGKTLNFKISVFDDREDYLNKTRFPDADELVLGSISENLSKYPIDENSYICIVTRSHREDCEALKAVVESNAKYVGLMGSKKKIKEIFDELLSNGIDENKLSKVKSPIGLDIATNSPEELAISIIAEILAVKNNKLKSPFNN
jgi:xanthine dehydrogenase accessory factor